MFFSTALAHFTHCLQLLGLMFILGLKLFKLSEAIAEISLTQQAKATFKATTIGEKQCVVLYIFKGLGFRV